MIFEKFRVDGQVALVTGATRGIGLGIAEALGEAGARLFLSSKTPRPEVIDGLRRKGFVVDYIAADMADPAIDKALKDSIALAHKSGIDGTPTFIMNGKLQPGMVDEASLADKMKS